MKKILIIEDDAVLSEELCTLLKNSGYEASRVTDFETTADQMRSSDADLILLDINLPFTGDKPVIMLTSRTTEIDEVLSMSYGADDYITKPYNPTILLLRVSAVLKRLERSSSAQVMYHDAEVSTVKGSLTRNGNEMVLTKNEMIIFQLLLDRKGEIVTRDDLMTTLWDNNEFVNDNALSVNVSRLRGKLAELGFEDAIETRKKQGYVLR